MGCLRFQVLQLLSKYLFWLRRKEGEILFYIYNPLIYPTLYRFPGESRFTTIYQLVLDCVHINLLSCGEFIQIFMPVTKAQLCGVSKNTFYQSFQRFTSKEFLTYFETFLKAIPVSVVDIPPFPGPITFACLNHLSD